tara:strand:- start:324 stop:611 length:288 start_codon:yes stop_codon:yes gene_type:complete
MTKKKEANLSGEKPSVIKSMDPEFNEWKDKLKKPEPQGAFFEMSQRYQVAYSKVLDQQPFWKKAVIMENTGQEDRVVNEFCKQVVELAESDLKLN